jgi:2,3-bisphosphoglycerate-dependent phosphoglycerate mutase
MKLVLLRHGESQWNLENRFTGWKDVTLTKAGKNEASFSGLQIQNNQIVIKSIYTSLLKRAIETTEIVADILNFSIDNIEFDWRLNERHYGALQGLNKSETALKYGEKQVQIWRRSYDIPPPHLDYDDKRHPRFNKKFQHLSDNLPVGESLRNVIDRLESFWESYFKMISESNGDHLIVAHSNSLRAIIKILEKLSDEEIVNVNIPTGVPLVYTFDNDMRLLDKKYLIDDNTLKEKEQIILNQGKIK